MRKLFVVLLLSTSVLFSCQKEAGFALEAEEGLEEPGTPDPSNTSALLVGVWKMSANTVTPAIDYNGDGTKETNVFPVMENCEKDGIITFTADKNVTEDEGPTICDPDDPQSVTTKWSLSADNKTLFLEGWGTRDVVSITATTLVLKYKLFDAEDEIEYTFTVTFTKQ